MSGLSLILREDIVPPPQETYQQRIRAIVETAQDALDDSELPRARAIISEMQAMVLGRLHQAGVDNERLWAAHREKLALNAIDTVISDYADRFGKQLGKSLGTAYHSGAGTVDDGVSLVVSDWAKPTISTQEIAIAARYKPSLIRGMDEYAHDDCDPHADGAVPWRPDEAPGGQYHDPGDAVPVGGLPRGADHEDRDVTGGQHGRSGADAGVFSRQP